MNEELKTECGWIKLYHPKGALVTLPVTVEALDYHKLLANVGAMLDAGWLVQAPGLEEGEHKDDVGWLVKSSVGEEGTPAIDLYPANETAKYAMMRVYLNKAEDVSAFEYASRVKLKELPEYVGVGRLERGKSPQTDKLIVRMPKPFTVIWKDNPKYNPDEQDATKKKPKRLFVRWADQAPAPIANGEATASANQTGSIMPEGYARISATQFYALRDLLVNGGNAVLDPGGKGVILGDEAKHFLGVTRLVQFPATHYDLARRVLETDMVWSTFCEVTHYQSLTDVPLDKVPALMQEIVSYASSDTP